MNVVRRIACMAILLTGMAVNAQNRPGVFHFTHIPERGDTTLSGWLYHEGDDYAWAGKEVDEKGWESFTVPISLDDFVKTHPNHLGWFRLTLKVPSNLRNRIVGIVADAEGATEIYLNGKLVRKLGIIDADRTKVQVVNNIHDPFSVYFGNDSSQLLAVRFAYGTSAWRSPAIVSQDVLLANIGVPDSTYPRLPSTVPLFLKYIFGFFVGLNLVVAALHGSFFFYYKGQRRNLYYSLFALFASLSWLTTIVQIGQPLENSRFYLGWLNNLFIAFSPAFFTLTIYSIFNYEKRRWLIVLLVSSTIVYFLQGFIDKPYMAVSVLVFAMVYPSEALRVVWVQRSKKLPGSNLIFKAILLGNIFGYISILILLFGNPVTGISLLSLSGASFMLMMSVAIAKQLADTNIQLKSSLAEVNELSHANEEMFKSQNQLLEEQVAIRTNELNRSMADLKSTQAQLIHSEKMASLGELTAGIAHEIQNPLNFVNNFSDINMELIDELKGEINNGNLLAATPIVEDILQNESKINHHGRRADGIVKGMLQHSRSSNHHEKELTDLNKLCDEYLRLSYHGLRAKDKSFNASFLTDFATDLPLVNVHPQELGRVILNLVNNAFYAVHERKKVTANEYDPGVVVATLSRGSMVQVKVTDNGNGISHKSIDKIFQPFFTTKPTGEGTGLGLSLSYDIIKAHGGTIEVESAEGSGTSFVVQLPFSL